MQDYKSVDKLLTIKNEFVDALKTDDKITAQNKLKDMRILYRKITGKDFAEMFSEAELEIIEKAIGTEYKTLLGLSPKEEPHKVEKDEREK